MGRQRRRIPSAVPVALSVVVAVALSGCSDSGGGDKKDESQQTASDFLAAWQAGDTAKASGLTDDPTKAKAGLDAAAAQIQLRGAEYTAKGYTKADGDKPGSLAYHSKITVQGIPTPVEFDSAVPVLKRDGKTLVHWQSTIVHPAYVDGAKFTNSRKSFDRASILDRNGQPLVGAQPVVVIEIWPSKMTNPDAVYAALRDPVFGGVDVDKLKARVAASPPDNAVSVVTLRKAVFESQAQPKLRNLSGIKLTDSTRQIAADAGQQLIGTVGEATKEILAKKGYENAGPGDQVGTSGLQARYQSTLAGVANAKVTIKPPTGNEVVLAEVQGKQGTPVKTTIDPKMQSQAEKSVKISNDKNAAIVALDATTGEILAAANNPPNGSNRAFEGQYAPGSTFKTVTSAALLQAGMKIGDPAECSETLVVNGQTFKNYDGLKPIANATFQQDFMQSCNTGFISQRDKLKDDTLNKTASDLFGIGQQWDVGASTFDGSVPPANSPNDKAASMIGQGRVVASPLVMASVAASVDSGTFNQPILVSDPALKRLPSKGLPPEVANQLKSLMQSVATGGTAAPSLAGIPGTVGAKTGTAEFSENGQTLTNGWMIAFKNNIAIAVLVEHGESGGKAAGPIVADFFRNIP
ncbi:penicillin-binding transpeptidase domain-containing protein [Yinghuangia seranimata]|uniref:penicillin-binding transpeptidase domain-containing protein n=1 Tax=Yinghuangia seranimata TaxID=408067 RepID=UPI00248CAC84|nr:penicillin-binding transpeptidase domain-containing protein [Yinghuangia seranimata]MDI2126720.1 penicillin-binding transpeptidase domain-containing protein [Yinghuangia seranimata]